MWMVARAITTPDWEKAMLQIKNYDEEAWNDLQKLNPSCWTMSAFKYRHKPIITLLEGIQFYISSRIVKLRTTLMRKWELTGIPCTHSITCMWINGIEPELSVNSYYRKSTVLTTYSFIVYLCNGPNLWPPLQTPVMLPPVMKRALGRPKKARNKKNDEFTKKPYLPRQSRSAVCKNGKAIGHNRRTCKGKTSADRTIPKGGNKNLKRQSPCPTPVAAKKQNIGPSTSQTPSAGHQRGDNTSETQQSRIS
ncbi:hypothetical protein HKD37_19G053406 [Glycine soja]